MIAISLSLLAALFLPRQFGTEKRRNVALFFSIFYSFSAFGTLLEQNTV